MNLESSPGLKYRKDEIITALFLVVVHWFPVGLVGFHGFMGLVMPLGMALFRPRMGLGSIFLCFAGVGLLWANNGAINANLGVFGLWGTQKGGLVQVILLAAVWGHGLRLRGFVRREISMGLILIEAGIGLAQMLLDDKIFGLLPGDSWSWRAYGTVGSPVFYGQWLGVMLPWAWGGRWGRLAAGSVGVGLVISGSRGGVLGAVVALAVLSLPWFLRFAGLKSGIFDFKTAKYVSNRNRNRNIAVKHPLSTRYIPVKHTLFNGYIPVKPWIWKYLCGIAIISIFCLGLSLNRGHDLAQSDSGRRLVFEACWRGFLEKPWFGWGFENTIYAIMKHRDAVAWDEVYGRHWQDHAHNSVLEALVAGGVVWAVAWLLWCWSIFRESRSIRARASLAALAVGSMFNPSSLLAAFCALFFAGGSSGEVVGSRWGSRPVALLCLSLAFGGALFSARMLYLSQDDGMPGAVRVHAGRRIGLVL